MTKPIKLTAETVEFIDHLHRGGAHRFTQDLSGKNPTYWSRTDEPLRLPPDHDAAQIYFSVNPVTERVTDDDRANPKKRGQSDEQIEKFVASKNRTIAAINCLYREFDGKDCTSPSEEAIEAIYQTLRAKPENKGKPEKGLRNEARGAAKSAEYKKDPAKYKAMALAAAEAVVPYPSVIAASGGGYNTYCLLAEPLIIRTSEHDHYAHIESYAADLQKRWVQMDPAADQNVHDLRRIFRPPGTTNHKPAYGPNFPVVTCYAKDMTRLFTVAELAQRLPPVVEPERTTPKANRPAQTRTYSARDITPGNTVIHAYNEATSIVTILEHYGYTHKDGRMMRPGGDQAGVDIDTINNRSRHWSSNDDLCDPHWRSAFDVYLTYEHGGDMKAAVKAAAAMLGLVMQRPDITPIIDTLRLWNKTTSVAALLPAGPGSKKVRPVLDSLFDEMQEQNSLSIVAGKKRIARRCGVSANTAKNVLALVNEHIFDVAPTEFGDRISLVSNSRLQEFDPLLDLVKAMSLWGQKTANEKNAYSPHKADDAFATGTSRYMKDRIKDISQELDLTYPQAAKEYTHRGLGEGVLLAFDTWLRLGDFTAQEYADETGLKLSTVRVPLRYAETMGLAETEREGQRGPKTYSFVPDFWEKISELTPNLRTYKLFDQRENKRLEAAQQWTQAELEKAQQAGAQEEAKDLQARFDSQARQRLPLLSSLHPDLSMQDIERLAYEVAAYKRSPQLGSAIRTARTEGRTEHRDEVTMIRELAESFNDVDTPLEHTFDKIMQFGVFDERVVRSVLQSARQMAKYETLEDLRQRIRQEDLALPVAAINTAPSYSRNQMTWVGAA